MTTLRASVPANLLLLGEYAVLEEGGLGVAIAADVRGTATFEAFHSAEGDIEASAASPGPVTIEGIMPGQTVRWSSPAGATGSLNPHDEKLERMATLLSEKYGTRAGTFSIDTRRLFDQDGAKRGYGSSAVSAALLTALWEQATATDRTEPGPRTTELLPTAIAAHRATQGGRGSGYDVATSLTGGIVLFTGGHAPTARRISLQWLKDLFLFTGTAPVQTPGAVRRYESWKRDYPNEATRFLGTSNALVVDFTSAATAEAAAEIFRRYTELGKEIGERIGVPATIAAPRRMPAKLPVKAIGAGNELGVAWDLEGSGELTNGNGFESIPIAAEGVEWR